MGTALKKFQTEMVNGELDALLLYSPNNRFYATAFKSSDGMVVITKEKMYLLTDERYEEAALTAESLKSANAEIVIIRSGQKYSRLIAEICARDGIKKIGFEDDILTVGMYNRFSEAIKAEFVPAAKLIETVKAQKMPHEIECIIKAQRIAEAAFEKILKIIKPGMTEKQIAAHLISEMYLNGAEGLSFEPIVVSGKNGAMPHGIPSDKTVENGEFITMDFGCIFDGYCSDMTRTVALGNVDDKMKKVYQIVLNAQKLGIDAMKCGNSCHLADAAARSYISDMGYGEYFKHSLGHGIGTECHEIPYIGPKSENVFLPGMVVTSEPGIYIPDKFGLRIEDMLIIREDSTENITKAPKDLIQL